MGSTESIWLIVAAVLLAVAGGLARQFYEQDKKPRKKNSKQILKGLYIAFFSGCMTLLLALVTGVTGLGVVLVCGIGGWTSPNILHFITRTSEKILGTEKDELNGGSI